MFAGYVVCGIIDMHEYTMYMAIIKLGFHSRLPIAQNAQGAKHTCIYIFKKKTDSNVNCITRNTKLAKL